MLWGKCSRRLCLNKQSHISAVSASAICVCWVVYQQLVSVLWSAVPALRGFPCRGCWEQQEGLWCLWRHKCCTARAVLPCRSYQGILGTCSLRSLWKQGSNRSSGRTLGAKQSEPTQLNQGYKSCPALWSSDQYVRRQSLMKKNPTFLQVPLVHGGDGCCCVCHFTVWNEMVLYSLSNTWVSAPSSFLTYWGRWVA